MGTLATIISAISDDVVVSLAAAGYPPLTPDAGGNVGKILVGTAAQYEQAAPPRIIFEPTGAAFSAAEYYSATSDPLSLERKTEKAQRTIATDSVEFKIRCWGAGVSAVDDYDVTRALYQAVRASIHRLLPGAYDIEARGKYTTGASLNRDGREFVFGLVIHTPILTSLLPYDRVRQYAPDGVTPLANTILNTAVTEVIPVS